MVVRVKFRDRLGGHFVDLSICFISQFEWLTGVHGFALFRGLTCTFLKLFFRLYDMQKYVFAGQQN